MKRTYKQSLSFFNTRKTINRGFGRELYQTPKEIIVKIVENLLLVCPELQEKTWIDPCAGDGRWEKIIKSFCIDCYSFDIKPLTKNVVKQDFFMAEYKDNDCFIIGNPPFSSLRQFVYKALEITDSCYFLGGSQIITGKLATKVRLLHRFEGAEGNQKDKRTKVLFYDTFNKLVPIWCCGAMFTKDMQKQFDRLDYRTDRTFAISPKVFCKYDSRVVNIDVRENNGFY